MAEIVDQQWPGHKEPDREGDAGRIRERSPSIKFPSGWSANRRIDWIEDVRPGMKADGGYPPLIERRDPMIVARQFIAWNASNRESVDPEVRSRLSMTTLSLGFRLIVLIDYTPIETQSAPCPYSGRFGAFFASKTRQ